MNEVNMQPYEDMLGMGVYDRDSEKIGKIEVLYTDTDGGEPRFDSANRIFWPEVLSSFHDGSDAGVRETGRTRIRKYVTTATAPR